MIYNHGICYGLYVFLKVYATEHVNAAIVSADEKTFRKWSWRFVKLIKDLKVVSAPYKKYFISFE